MSEPQTERPPWINHFYAIVPDAGGTRILMRPSPRSGPAHDGMSAPEAWQLPYLRTQDIWLSSSARISALLRADAGLDFDFTILRHTGIEADEQERWDRILFVLEPSPALEDVPGDGEWMDAARLQTLPLAHPEQRTHLLDYLAENAARAGNPSGTDGDAAAKIDPRRAPWARPGWFAVAAAWITDAIAELGHTQSGPVEQLRNWSISSLLVAPTSAGRVFFKAAAALPLFVNEPALTQTLATLFPAHIPTPLKIDRERRWMLMEDFGTHTWDDDNLDLAPILVAYGTLQRESAHHLDALRAAGCFDRRLEVLATQIDSLIADPTTQASLTAAEYAELVALAPALKARCDAVAAYNLPATLLHGDLHLGNVTQRNGEFIFFDWTDAAIGFPFLDFFQLYFAFDANDETTRWRDAYLAQWTAYESPARLREAWELAKPLCALHHAISYLTIVNHIEPLARDELFHGLPDNLQRLLAAMRG